MCKSEFERESYGRPKLALPISKGGAEMLAYPRFPFYLDLLSSETPCLALMVPGTHILGP